MTSSKKVPEHEHEEYVTFNTMIITVVVFCIMVIIMIEIRDDYRISSFESRLNNLTDMSDAICAEWRNETVGDCINDCMGNCGNYAACRVPCYDVCFFYHNKEDKNALKRIVCTKLCNSHNYCEAVIE